METNSFEIAKKIFWRHANLISKKELKSEFLYDDENMHVVKAFVAYFTGNVEQMTELGLNHRKGILIYGNPGSGKSMLFRILRSCLQSEKIVTIGERDLPERRFFEKCRMLTCEHMAKLYMAEGEVKLHAFGKNAVKRSGDDYYPEHACFDDLGSEEIRNNYGNLKEVMVDLIQERYDLFLTHGLKTHFTTNLTGDEIKNRYHSRVTSRLKHMCNFLALGNSTNYTDRR